MSELIELLKSASAEKKDGSSFSKVASQSHEFYLSGELESAENYITWFDTIRHAGESDFVKIYINSPGGDLFTAIQFMRVLAETQATVCCSVEGACMSAATMIFLCADQFEVTPHSMFMFHNYSGGTFGKGGEMIDQLQHERIWSERMLRETYANFLSEKEITSILDNKDIWMDGTDVVSRLTSRMKLIKAERSEDITTKPPRKKSVVKKQQNPTE